MTDKSIAERIAEQKETVESRDRSYRIALEALHDASRDDFITPWWERRHRRRKAIDEADGARTRLINAQMTLHQMKVDAFDAIPPANVGNSPTWPQVDWPDEEIDAIGQRLSERHWFDHSHSGSRTMVDKIR